MLRLAIFDLDGTLKEARDPYVYLHSRLGTLAASEAFFRDPGGEHIEARDLRMRLTLRPFAVARLDAPAG